MRPLIVLEGNLFVSLWGDPGRTQPLLIAQCFGSSLPAMCLHSSCLRTILCPQGLRSELSKQNSSRVGAAAGVEAVKIHVQIQAGTEGLSVCLLIPAQRQKAPLECWTPPASRWFEAQLQLEWSEGMSVQTWLLWVSLDLGVAGPASLKQFPPYSWV